MDDARHALECALLKALASLKVPLEVRALDFFTKKMGWCQCFHTWKDRKNNLLRKWCVFGERFSVIFLILSLEVFVLKFDGLTWLIFWQTLGWRRFKYITGWWFQIFFIFTPIWGRFPFWLIFFKWVETTNQIKTRVWIIPVAQATLYIAGLHPPKLNIWMECPNTSQCYSC